MAISVGDIVVHFGADITGLIAGAGAAEAAVAGFAVAGVAAVVGFGAASVKMAADWQMSMTHLVTDAGELPRNLQMVSNGLQKIAMDTGTSLKDLGNAMYLVESAGYHGQAGLDVMRVAAEGAKVGNADLTQVTDVLTTALHDYGLSAAASVPVMNSLIATTSSGKMHMDDLTGAFRNVLPVASTFHISITDVEGALAAMSLAGDKGSMAGTHLAMMFKNLENPASAASKEMKAMGLDSVAVAREMSISLPGALQMIQDAVAKHFTPGSVEYNRAIATILGGSKSGVAGLEILNGHMKDLKDSTDKASSAFRNGGKDVKDWSAIQDTFNNKMDRFRSVIEVLMERIGEKLLPIIGRIVDAVAPAIRSFADWIMQGDNFQKVLNVIIPVVAFLAALILGSLVLAFILLLAAVGPAVIIIIGMAIQIGLLVAVIMNWGAIVHWFQGIWNAVWSAVSSFFVGILNNIKGAAAAAWSWLQSATSAAWNAVANAIRTAIGNVVAWLANIWNTIKNAAAAAWNYVVSVFQGAGPRIIGALSGLSGAIANFFGSMYNNALIWGRNIVVGIANGIIGAIHYAVAAAQSLAASVAAFLPHSPAKVGPLADLDRTGPAFVNEFAAGIANSSSLLTSSMNNLLGHAAIAGGGGGGTPTIQIYLDGHQVSGYLAKNMVTSIRSTGPVGRIA